MTLVTGQPTPVDGFVCVEARVGHYEVATATPSGTRVNFLASTEERALAKASSWLADQAKRKTPPRGRPVVRRTSGLVTSLTTTPTTPKKEKPSSEDVVAA